MLDRFKNLLGNSNEEKQTGQSRPEDNFTELPYQSERISFQQMWLSKLLSYKIEPWEFIDGSYHIASVMNSRFSLTKEVNGFELVGDEVIISNIVDQKLIDTNNRPVRILDLGSMQAKSFKKIAQVYQKEINSGDLEVECLNLTYKPSEGSDLNGVKFFTGSLNSFVNDSGNLLRYDFIYDRNAVIDNSIVPELELSSMLNLLKDGGMLFGSLNTSPIVDEFIRNFKSIDFEVRSNIIEERRKAVEIYLKNLEALKKVERIKTLEINNSPNPIVPGRFLVEKISQTVS